MTARLRLRGLLDQGRPAGGLFLSLPAPQIVEIAAVAGFDFVLIDLEHTLIGGRELEELIAAADRSGISALVRVADARSERILPVLDAGAAGIVVARVSSLEDAREAIRRARYAPLGNRGLNAGRLGRFGDCDLPALLRQLDRETLLIALIEDAVGLAAAEEIASLPGLDGLLLGAADYSQSIGAPWQTTAESVRAADRQLAAIARRTGRYFFAIPRRDEDVVDHLRDGALGIIAGNDRGVLRQALSSKDRLWREIYRRQELQELEAGE
ncbi:aldolase/citrate lyase family protein [Methylocystis sp. JR02]|uniref:HpcH/HpaI aldolase family protein n=1 Tax=Methylocystis sp. JR02 TaxID=3046284 RepID=UPI0024B98DD1|nr:aldolase/citrate lyase family protein [Methylocystis sp. JR02]MDJ0450665.1 aldolase/citrate lyase family protein [Methylocystis sp. JR02]